MSSPKHRTVSEVARSTGISVRTLHHYDEIGLLVPSGRSRSGYRLYSDEDVQRLHHILVARELGMSLVDVKRSLDDPSFDRRSALVRQRAELVARIDQNRAVLRGVEAALAALEAERNGEPSMSHLKDSDFVELFGGFDPKAYDEEVRARWGETEAWAESQRRVARYDKADWQRFRIESDALLDEAAQLFRGGAGPDSEAAMDLAERHRRSISAWFYACSPEHHARLADLYEADERYAASFEAAAAGLTSWLARAIRANAAR
jgi:MerR family transcriptional regulator, thiopeptide resistance regulator